MAEPFGRSYLLDLYGCREGACDDMELNYRFLEQLVDLLGMTKMAPPYVIHAPRLKGVEVYPDKAGVSGWVPLIESGIQIHTLQPKNFISIDVYSCGPIDAEKVKAFARQTYGFTNCEEHFLERGMRYNDA